MFGTSQRELSWICRGDEELKSIVLHESGKDINDGDQFVAVVDEVEGHRRVTLQEITP